MTTLDKDYGRQYVSIYCVKPRNGGPAVWGVRTWQKSCARGVMRLVDNDGQEHLFEHKDDGYGLDENFQGVKISWFSYGEYVRKVGTTLENGEVVPVINEHLLQRVAIERMRTMVADAETNVSELKGQLKQLEEDVVSYSAHLAAMKEWLVTNEMAMLSTQ